MVLSETRGLELSAVIRGGIGLRRRLGAQGYTHGLPSEWILTLEPSVSRTRLANTMDDPMRELETAQAACCFKCLASKLTPFFQMINVIAAIFLATVRRAIVGFIPLASNAS
jgi:hypothetical protein